MTDLEFVAAAAGLIGFVVVYTPIFIVMGVVCWCRLGRRKQWNC